MQAMHMIRHSPYYATLTGGCTIRKWDGKYCGLQVGDNIVMNHSSDPQSLAPDVVHATELLQVNAIALSDLETLLLENYEMEYTVEDIHAFYPVAEGQERNPADLYCAIHFN